MYCSVEQVQNDFKALKISSATVLTEDMVTEYIQESDAEIDSIIGVRYITPVVDDAALILCRRMSRAMTVDRVAEKLSVSTSAANVGQPLGKSRRQDALDLATKIANGTVSFGAAQTVAQANDVSGFATAGVSCPPKFNKDRKQW